MNDDWIRRHGDVHACEKAAEDLAKQREQEQDGVSNDGRD